MRVFTIRTDDTKLRALIRGQAVRPAQKHRDRRREAQRRACRGWREEG